MDNIISVIHRVVNGSHRPDIDPAWPPDLVTLMQEGWTQDPSYRPTATEMQRSFADLLVSFSAGEEQKLIKDLSSLDFGTKELDTITKNDYQQKNRTAVINEIVHCWQQCKNVCMQIICELSKRGDLVCKFSHFFDQL